MSIPGAVVGTLVVGFAKTFLSESYPEIWLFFLGGIYIFVVLIMPNGLAGVSVAFVEWINNRRRKSGVSAVDGLQRG
jgi:urea transport system permease protein